jgi:hypothetical protein
MTFKRICSYSLYEPNFVNFIFVPEYCGYFFLKLEIMSLYPAVSSQTTHTDISFGQATFLAALHHAVPSFMTAYIISTTAIAPTMIKAFLRGERLAKSIAIDIK